MKNGNNKKASFFVRIALSVICLSLPGNHPLIDLGVEAGGHGSFDVKSGTNKAGFSSMAAGALQSTAGTEGRWSPVESWEDIPVHISLLPSGKLLYWGRDKDANVRDIESRCNTYLYDPVYKKTTKIENLRTNLFCSSHSFLPDGRLIVAGGHEIARNPNDPAQPPPPRYEVEAFGSKHINFFDYVSESWSPGPDMQERRWYPSQVMLENGEVLITAGSYVKGWTSNNLPDSGENVITEIYQSNNSLRRVGNLPLEVANYPFLSKARDGKVLLSQQFGQTGFVYDPNLSRWYTHSEMPVQTSSVHGSSTAASYDGSKLMVISGRNGSNCMHTKVEVANLNNLTDGYVEAASLNFKRNNHTAAVLPDGKVFVVGGAKCKGSNNFVGQSPDVCNGLPATLCTDGAVMTPELYNPAANQWAVMAPHQVPRSYHSTALLMPDGRVLVGGGGRPGAYGETGPFADPDLAHKDVEYFSPPYLFNADGTEAVRPAITSAPSRVAYNQSFGLGVGNIPASQLGQAVLIRLPSVTHGINFDQRRVPLSLTASGEFSVNLTAPASAGECPPGPYMLFVLSQNGTPSVARIVFVGDTALSLDSATFPSIRNNGSPMDVVVQVHSPSGRFWQVTDVPNWVTVTSAASGFGSAPVSFRVSSHTPNAGVRSSLRPRSATIKIAGQPFRIFQGAQLLDVPIGHLFHDEIEKLYARGITEGCVDNGLDQLRSFCPESQITREEMAVFLIRGRWAEPPEGRPNPFNDVQPNTPFYKYVVDLYERQVTTGCSFDPSTGVRLFCPTNKVNRAEMAVFVERALGVNSPLQGMPPFFADISGGQWAWAYNFINDFGRRGITLGCGGGNYCPANNVTRGQMSAFLNNAFGW